MKVLLDECVHHQLKSALAEYDVRTVADKGWRGIVNGKLLALAATEFDVFLTVDKNLQYQQNLSKVPITVIVVHSRSLRWEDLRPHIPAIEFLLRTPLEQKLYEIS